MSNRRRANSRAASAPSAVGSEDRWLADYAEFQRTLDNFEVRWRSWALMDFSESDRPFDESQETMDAIVFGTLRSLELLMARLMPAATGRDKDGVLYRDRAAKGQFQTRLLEVERSLVAEYGHTSSVLVANRILDALNRQRDEAAAMDPSA